MFVCDHDSHVVIQVSEDGRKVGQVLGPNDGIKSPVVICYDRKKSRLLVTMKGCNYARVFDLV